MAKLQVSRLPDHSDPRWVAVEHILCVENFKGSHLKKNMFSLIIFKNNLSFYLFTWLCWVSCPRGICSLLQYSNFWLMHVGSSSRPRDRTPAPFIRSTESEPLNHQGSLHRIFQFLCIAGKVCFTHIDFLNIVTEVNEAIKLTSM